MIVAVILVFYTIVWLYTARQFYGRWRAKGIDSNIKKLPNLCSTTAKATETWNEIDRVGVMLGAFGVALFWPLMPVFALLIWFVSSAPQMSQAEMRDRLAKRDQRIADLEREAGIKP